MLKRRFKTNWREIMNGQESIEKFLMRGIVVSLLVLIILYPGYALGQKIEPQQVLTLDWGSGENQIGYVFHGVPIGPSDFAVDTMGNICIVDQVNHKVKEFDKSGSLIASFVFTDARRPGSIILGKDDGGIYVFIKGHLPRVKKFDKEGHLLINRRVDVSGGDLSIDAEGSIYVNRPSFEMVKLDDELNQIFRKPQQGEGLPLWHIVNGRALKLREIKEDGKYKIGVRQVEDFRAKKGKASPLLEKGSIIPVSTAEKEYLLSPRPIGEDDEGNLYIVYTVGRRRAYHRRVLKLSPNGEKIGEIDIHTEWRAGIERPFEVDGKGNVYLMNCDEEKVWIDKYPAEMFK